MTEHLHSFNFFSSNNFVLANRAYAIHSLISRLILYLFCLISVFSLSAQEVDNWYSADRAINAPSPVGDLFLFTPYAPADGTPVNVWYELVDYNFNFTQNAMEHPPGPYPGNYNRPWENYPNHGFQHPGGPGFLTPTGAIPGVPTLRRDVMNFNPAVQFDGTSGGGAGEALYFRSHARDESMVIVVFSAPGAGTTAETQSLLFGGDITNHLNTITNLSLGVSSGNRFSVGRTWDSGTFFQTGGIDLLERPTIGVLSRSFPAVQQETLTTRVNGLNDVNITRLDPTAQESLFYYNRMGKHFNDADPGGISDPSNLSGYIAEVMLVEGISDANHIQRLESYLAIKYGITLNAIGGLGSINGNDSYNYLAADGTIIWPFDATYRYDIAGIGKDRFNDSGVNRLRYNLHQRISKSVNAEARVTISTNSDFSADNLDDTRTAIDASHFSLPRELNYLVWGNDHGDIIFPTNVNTPVGFDGRIPRQWRIIETRSGGTNPIINVSVRIDLTGSDLLNYEACEIFLIIDEDGNGNFGDGVITSIEASSIIGSDVFFYNVNFVGTDVFTVAYLEDVQPPTASNPAPLTVCEVIPLPDTSVVTDEADNCAVDTVVHISDVSNLMSNPETITRTYRVTDTSGNFMDVFQTITIYTTPDAGNDNTVQICEGDATPLSLPASLGGVPELGGTWTDVNNVLGNGLNSPITDATAAAMNFSTVASGSYDFVYTITATAPCNETFATITVTVNSTPTVDVLADVTVCDSFELPALTTGDYFTGTGGTGTPLSAGDDILTTQTVFIYAETGTTPNCSDESSFTVTVNSTPTVDVLADVTVCDSFELPALTTGDYFTGTGGTGTPLSAGDDILTTQTVFIYAETGTTPNCSDESSFTVTVNSTPTVDVLADVTVCDSFELPALTTGDYFTGTGGTGTPLSAGDDILTTQTVFIYAETGTTPNCSDESSFTVTVNSTPTVDVLADVTVCDSFELPALTTGDYFTGTGGTGTPLSAGDDILTTQTVFIYAETGTTPNCSDESSFTVTVNSTPTVDVLADVTVCDSFELPALTTGDYFTGTGGTGTPLSAGDDILTTQTVFIYAETGTTPNCSDESSFTVTVNSTPTVDVLADVTVCDSFELPALTTGDYFTGTGGTGTPLSAGDDILTTQTVFIYAETGTTPNCSDESSFTVTVNSTPTVDVLADVTVCDSFELPALTTGDYFTGTGGTGTPLSAGDDILTTQTVFIYAETGTTPNCSDESSFTVTVNSTPTVDVLADVTVCDSFELPALTTGDYFTGTGGTGTPLSAGDDILTTQTVFIYAETGTTPNCSDESSFTVTVNSTPTVDVLADVTVCDSFELPALTTGDYFTGTGGTGTPLSAGDDILTTQTVFIYAETGTTPNCSDESSFTVTVNSTPTVDVLADVTVCDSFELPALTTGDYFTGTGGTGTPLSAGDDILTTQTVFIYAETGTTPNCSDESSFTVTVNSTPTVDVLADVTVCDSFELPALTTGDYFTGTGGTGTPLSAGDDILTTQTVFIYAETGTTPNCSDESSFTVTVNSTPTVDVLADVTVCDSFELPALTTGDYFTGTGGTGTPLSAGDDILTTQTVFIYAETGTTPNCSDESSFTVTVNSTPTVDVLADVTVCDSFELPALTTGDYFTGTGGTGTPLSAGDDILTTQTVFIYAETGTTPNCSDESSFTVTVNSTPTVDVLADVTVCDSFELPALTTGDYFTGTGGTGTPLSAGDDILTTQTVFIYAETGTTPNCSDESSFTVTVNSTPTVDVLADVTVCDSFELPALTTGDYFTGTGGTGTPLSAGDDILTTQTVFIYAETGTTPNCSDESSFTVTVNSTPTVDVLADVTVCDSFELPALTTGDYFTGTGGTGTPLSAGDDILTTQTVFIYAETGTTPNCSDESSFTVTVNSTPTVDVLADVTVCDSFELPALTTGDYFTGTGGTGTPLSAGDDILTTQTVFIYAETGTTPNCSDESSFTVTVNSTPTVDVLADVTVCDSFELPALTTGDYFTGTGGTGTPLSAGDDILTTQTVFIYAETGTTPNCSDESSFTVTVNSTPTVDVLADVTVCDSFELPALTTGDYFTGTGGTGTPLSAGDDILTTQTVFIYAETGTTPNCSDESSFTVTVNSTPTVDVLADVTVCDSFELPALTTGDYFTGTGGTGTPLSAGDDILTTQTVFIYAETGTTPNCSDESSFTVTVNSTPTVDVLADVTVCDSFELPALTTGDYFTGTGGTGTPLSAGDDILTTQTVFIYAETGTTPNCSDESSFTVTVNSTPTVDVLADVTVCDSFELPALTTGDYFTGTGGTGTPLSAGDDILTTQTVFIYAETGTTPNCSDESSFTVTVNSTPTVDVLADVTVCDSFELPALTTGDYFTGTGGTGTPLSAGDDILTTQTVFIYAETGTTPNCSDESSFTVTVNRISALVSMDNELCLDSGTGSINVLMETGVAPYTVQLNAMQAIIFNTNSFTINDLVSGNYTLNITDADGCETSEIFDIEAEGIDLSAEITPVYGCDLGEFSNYIDVELNNSIVSSDVLYALDSTDPNDFIINPDFINISEGEHFLSILHVNGCMETIPFEIEEGEPLRLSLNSSNINQITATVTGGTAPYTYFFDDQSGSGDNTYSITYSGIHLVRVLDGNGCEVIQTISLDFLDIEIPNFFTPNNDGIRDVWKPKNIEGFSNIETVIFDRYGREIRLLGALGNGWDGFYEGKPLPSGDYWYIVKLNDGSEREFVGNFTLYR
ncbi:T9SS type B sorting domain-containing protein [Flagellimonas sp. W118]|uniref:T9SS type B sorting domain-containing protein n=1 Tax=Flagellimonas sp. W118 TaxID=3410791 RepID=UPI003BF56E06